MGQSRDNGKVSRDTSRDNGAADFGEQVGPYEARSLRAELGVLRSQFERFRHDVLEGGRNLYWGVQRISEAVDQGATDVAVRVRDVLDRAGRIFGLPTTQDPPENQDEDDDPLGLEIEVDVEATTESRPPSSPPELKLVASDGETVPKAPETRVNLSTLAPKRSDWEIRKEEGPPPLEIANPRVQAFMLNAFNGTRQGEFLWRDFTDGEVEMLEEVHRQACAMVGGDEAHGFALYDRWLSHYATHQPDRRRSGPDAQTMEEWLAQMVRDCNPAGFMKQMPTYADRTVEKPWYTVDRTLEDLLDARREQYTQFGVRKS